MRMAFVNLARRPFVNSRPVVRLTTILWLGALALLAYDALLFYRNFTGTGRRAEELRQVDQAIADERQAIETLQNNLRGMDLGRQNAMVRYLNGKIAERTFTWSRLFDELTDVLPMDSRILTLSPRQAEEQGGPAARQPGEDPLDRFQIDVIGEAKTDEALLELVDAFYGSPLFENPDLTREDRDVNSGLIRFTVRVEYLPRRGAEEAL